jgi:uncharacterized protein (DUF427 family)
MANPAPGFSRKPDHRIDLLPERRRVRVSFGGAVIADSRDALRIEETGHGPVHYLPEKDVRTDLLQPTDHSTHCPFKGDASYWTIQVPSQVSGGEGRRAENAVWGYRTPFDEAAGLAGHYAFYRNRVDAIEVE